VAPPPVAPPPVAPPPVATQPVAPPPVGPKELSEEGKEILAEASEKAKALREEYGVESQLDILNEYDQNILDEDKEKDDKEKTEQNTHQSSPHPLGNGVRWRD